MQKKDGLKLLPKEDEFWKKYAMPEMSQVESLPVRDFYEQGKTNWYYALTKKAYLTKNVETIITLAQSHKNIIVVGIPLSGKTMTLMQVACKIGKPTFFMDNLNEAEARLICNNAIQDQCEYIVLVDNCSDDMRAYRMLAECKNIRTIATSDDFMYESSKHILEGITFEKIDIHDIEYEEAQRIFSHIPSDLKRDKFKYKQNDGDKYSILELIASNVKNVISKNKVLESLRKVKAQNIEAFEMILLTTYLVYYKSALTTDSISAYFGITTIGDIIDKINLTDSYLAEMNLELRKEDYDQDYYTLRSAMFAQYTHQVALSNFRDDYGKVIKNFVHQVHPCRIWNNQKFSKRAYDAEFFFKVFSNTGDEVYESIYTYNPSAYTLQQWALYKAKTKRFSEAFADIDKALYMRRGNPSLENSRAIILFEANKDKNTLEAKLCLEEAMDTLEKCYKRDLRKVYHAQKYAEFALLFAKRYDNTYIEQAFLWLNNLIVQKDSLSWRTKNLYKQLNLIREKQNK